MLAVTWLVSRDSCIYKSRLIVNPEISLEISREMRIAIAVDGAVCQPLAVEWRRELNSVRFVMNESCTSLLTSGSVYCMFLNKNNNLMLLFLSPSQHLWALK